MISELEFNIEKVESLDFDKLSPQLKCIFKAEQDIVNFINFLKNVQKFVNLSNDKRHMVLMQLGYFKSQIQKYEKQIKNVLDKKKNEQIRAAIKKAKGIGEKISENVIIYHTEESTAIDSLEELYILVNSWTTYMQDLYFLTGQTNKNLGAIY